MKRKIKRIYLCLTLNICWYYLYTYVFIHTSHTHTDIHRKRSREIWNCSFTNTHADTSETIQRSFWLRERGKERLDTDTRIFRAHTCMHACVCCWPDHRHSQYMWTLEMYPARIRLQKHSRRCDTEHDGGFALQSTFLQPRKTSLEAIKHGKERETRANVRVCQQWVTRGRWWVTNVVDIVFKTWSPFTSTWQCWYKSWVTIW